jgi:hypothetical protein
MATMMSIGREAALDELAIAVAVAETTVDAWLDGEIAGEQPDADSV